MKIARSLYEGLSHSGQRIYDCCKHCAEPISEPNNAVKVTGYFPDCSLPIRRLRAVVGQGYRFVACGEVSRQSCANLSHARTIGSYPLLLHRSTLLLRSWPV